MQITRVHLTGGEPTLNIQGIRQVREIFAAHKIGVKHFYIPINGCRLPDEFITEVREWEKFCTSNIRSMVCISMDQYHPRCEFAEIIDRDRRFWKLTHIRTPYYEGNAVKNCDILDCKPLPYASKILQSSDTILKILAMNVYGDVYLWDLSYDRQRCDKKNNGAYYIGTVEESTIIEMVNTYNRSRRFAA